MQSIPTFEKQSTTREQSLFSHEKKDSSAKKDSTSKSASRHVRQVTKRLKCIYEDEGLDFGVDPEDEDTLVERFRTNFQLIRRARNVQLCFLVDVTGSMQPYIDGVRDSIYAILRKLTDDGPNEVAQSMQFAFVAYRDINDKKQFEVLSFTTADKFRAFSQGLVAGNHGNDDFCEDVFGGLDTALRLPWSETCGTKVVFHICDAPCHGQEFHSGVGTGWDNHPHRDPRGLTCTGLFSRLREKGIQYHFGRITSYTDIMLRKFSQAYGESITEFDVKDVDKIRDSVVTAVSLSISATVTASQRTAGVARKERDFTLDQTEPDWASLNEMKGKFVSYEFPKSIQDIEDDVALEQKKPKDAIVKIAKNPFGKGAERIAFYGKNLSPYYVKEKKSSSKSEEYREMKMNEEIVVKEYLHTGKGMNSAKRYELSNQMQTIASYLAQKFKEDLKEKAGIDKTIKFLKIKTLSIPLPNSAYRFMSSERRFGPDAKFVRFTNNAGYLITEEKAIALGVSLEFVELVFAFSHWTYKASKRFLMVVDLEGIVGKIESDGKTGVVLTDPAIHCRDDTRYGRMNHGAGGMTNFFERHECNRFCKALGLEGFVC